MIPVGIGRPGRRTAVSFYAANHRHRRESRRDSRTVHSLLPASFEDLEREFKDTSRDGYLVAQEISAYSLVVVTKAAKELKNENGSILRKLA
ncbi:hypothetical protein SFC23_07460 [Shouchella clausii]|uniref:hypothetical protein n=1 Tax=Shouchella clausii TaxID=79880 RepID=UPI003982BF41